MQRGKDAEAAEPATSEIGGRQTDLSVRRASKQATHLAGIRLAIELAVLRQRQRVCSLHQAAHLQAAAAGSSRQWQTPAINERNSTDWCIQLPLAPHLQAAAVAADSSSKQA